MSNIDALLASSPVNKTTAINIILFD